MKTQAELEILRIKKQIHWIDEHARSAKHHAEETNNFDRGRLIRDIDYLIESVESAQDHIQKLETLLREFNKNNV